MGEDESEAAEFLRVLRTLETPNPSELLYPLGRVLWFVPRIVMDDDQTFRRKTLMDMLCDPVNVEIAEDGLEEQKYDSNDQEEGLENDRDTAMSTHEVEGVDGNIPQWKRSLSESMRNLEEGLRVRSQSVGLHANQLWNELCHDVSRSVKDLQTDMRCKMDTSKRRKKYSGRNYVLCDATDCRYIFQEFVFDFPDSLTVHNPQRYLWACDATLRE